MFKLNYKSILLAFFTVISVVNCFAQETGRKIVQLNQNWSFQKGNNTIPTSSGNAKMVDLPHTWNAVDVMDDVPGYYRGIGWYQKKLLLRPEWKNKNIYIHFEGANQETTVYLNGKKVGSHIGGYTAFRILLPNLKFNGSDVIAVKVDNSFNENIGPLTADFTFFGGLYRNVSLVITEPIHFGDEKYAANGVSIHADQVSQESANIVIDGNLINRIGDQSKLKIVSTLKDASGRKIKEIQLELVTGIDRTVSFTLPLVRIDHPTLWSPEKPYLYTATTQLIAIKTGKVIDEIKTSVGLRYFSFDPEKGFFLNGMPYKLIGASRHQDFAGMGNAVPKALQIKDVEFLKNMGGNFLRVAHYPQDQAVLDACDRLGVLASVEIPIVNEITESDAFYANCKSMQLEMIKQNYNHPSIIIWAYMNEVLLKMKFNNDPERKKKYLANIELLAQQLEDLTRTTDPTRYTMMSNHGDVNGYIKAGLVKIPMLVGWNLYQGWYGGKSEDFGPGLDKIHQLIPDKPILVTEFGADADPRIHSFTPVRFDKSVEYAMLYHQIYIREIMKRQFVAGAAVWNLADFNSETRDETMPHINNKGLLTLDRQPKNTYYLYKANLLLKPFLKIGNGEWNRRGGVASVSQNSFVQNLQVISNADTVELFLNGKSQGKKQVIERIANWSVPFTNGINKLSAIALVKGAVLEDHCVLNFNIQRFSLNDTQAPFDAINILLGAQRQFIDEQRQEVWLPNQSYQAGLWGSIGGEVFKVKNGRQSYGTDKNIRGTSNDPIYQTQLEGIEGYQLDVPKGKYAVTMHFAELVGNANQSVLPYNLDSLMAQNKEVPPQRVFDVYLNNKLVIKNLNLAATYGVANSVQKKFDCVVTDEKGIRLIFKSSQGKAVLNALQVKRIE
jgi:beta-galactosidase